MGKIFWKIYLPEKKFTEINSKINVIKKKSYFSEI
jgi:hypothetical protein